MDYKQGDRVVEVRWHDVQLRSVYVQVKVTFVGKDGDLIIHFDDGTVGHRDEDEVEKIGCLPTCTTACE